MGLYNLTASAARRTSASLDFSIVSVLEITSLAPASGEPGSLIELLGNGFDPDPTLNSVVFFGNDPTNSTVAPVIAASATRLQVKVPATAQTGALTLTTPKGAISSPIFTVLRQQDFALNASPASQVLLSGSQAVYGLSLTSLGLQNFTGLATLKVSGLPAGVSAKFAPATSP